MQQHPDFGKNVPALQNKCPHCPARKSETALGHVVMMLSINGKFPLLVYLFILKLSKIQENVYFIRLSKWKWSKHKHTALFFTFLHHFKFCQEDPNVQLLNVGTL